jgi:CIC family chloride channel protein
LRFAPARLLKAGTAFVARFGYGREGRLAALGAVTGVIGGLFAVALAALSAGGAQLLLEGVAGTGLTHPAGQPSFFPPAAVRPERTWLVLFLPALGGLVCGLIARFWAPEAAGTGTEGYVHAFHHGGATLRRRVPFARTLATGATVGTGGAAGSEGPIMLIGAAVGATLARAFHLTPRERRILLVCGCAAGVGALFRAPLAGAISAIEMLYREDFESEALLPSILSSVTAYALYSAVLGQGHLFGTVPHELGHASELLIFAAVGVACWPAAVAWLRALRAGRGAFERAPVPRWATPALGGLGVGVLGFADPRLLGGGYAVFQEALLGDLELAVLALLVCGRVLATTLTVGSGGSGGLFAPTIVLGGLLGGVVGQAGALLAPAWAPDPAACVVVGMAAFFAGIAHAPIASVLMVSEVTGSYALLTPAILATGISLLLNRNQSLIRQQVQDRFNSPAHQCDLTVNVLRNLTVRDVFQEAAFDVIPARTPMSEVKAHLATAPHATVAVVGEDGVLDGLLALEHVREGIFEADMDDVVVAADMMHHLVSVAPDTGLHEALIDFIVTGHHVLPVIDRAEPNVILGVLTQQAVSAAYHQAVMAE